MSTRRPDISNEEVHFMHESEGMSLRAIADYYGVCVSTICNRLYPERAKEYYKNNKETILEQKREYYDNNKESILGQKKEYQLKKSKKIKEYNKKYRLEHPDYSKEWRQTKNGKAWIIMANARRRNLGSIGLNEPFDDSEFHHFNNDYGIYIPAEIHRSIYHNLKTGQGMEMINKEAFEFLEWEMREKQWEELEEGRGEY